MQTVLDLILLIDDDETTNYVNRRLLNRLNVAREIKIMSNGEEALKYLQRVANGNNKPDEISPDLIFLDIKMPVMDGFSFLEAYEQADIKDKNHIIIMMLTSSASFYDLERLKKYNKVKRHISKALTEADVREIIQDYFSLNGSN